ncbi:Transcriptional elongation regulator MINIYO [Vitis vinifera]|uniref:Transcriptional elongation regulator MINIYO n=1 Tax=Vitis vinifera TaxID=29760 RepID=A0A438IJC4_VITVI|nr:Transcriptional elongation regulator MINIYO [Vitis vinifera]
MLASHFRKRWLCVKKKFKAVESKSSSGQKASTKGSESLDTIPEDMDISNTTIQDHDCPSLLVEWAHQRLPLPVHWFLSTISTIHDGIEAMSSFLSSDVPSPVRSVPVIWKLHSLSVTLLDGMSVLEEEKSRDVYEALQELYGQLLDESRVHRSTKPMPETGEKNSIEFLRFQSDIHESYSTFIETLVEQFAAISYGDLIYGRQVAIYLHRSVEAPVRLAAWNALSNARVLELLPPLEKCSADAEGYLEPVENNEGILEAYVKSWVTGALDRAATRGSVTFTLVLHHLSSFIFEDDADVKLSLRNKLAKSLLRDYSRKRQHEGLMLQLIRYNNQFTSPQPEWMKESETEKRFWFLTEACEGNASLLKEVEKLKSSLRQVQ